MDEEKRSDAPQPEENPEEQISETPPDEPAEGQEQPPATPPEEPQGPETPAGPQPAAAAQVAGCWIGLAVLAALVVFVVYEIGAAISRRASQPPAPPTADIDQDGLGGGDLKAGEAYKENVTVRIVGLDPYEAASGAPVEEETAEPAPETPPETSSDQSTEEPADAQQPPAAPEPRNDYIVTAEATNLQDKTVTYLKVHLVLKDAAGNDLGETWVDAATARHSIRYIHNTGDLAPQQTKSFQGLVSLAPDVTPESAAADITALAVK